MVRYRGMGIIKMNRRFFIKACAVTVAAVPITLIAKKSGLAPAENRDVTLELRAGKSGADRFHVGDLVASKRGKAFVAEPNDIVVGVVVSGDMKSGWVVKYVS